ncbi:HD domain-containing protein [Lentibacillus lipolyticus]|nr:HD domain-containing protein [Lentibacillus lipolyticus]
MLLLSDKLTKSILDPIHGLIKMTEEEMEIISHPLFHRLRKIKQNTFLYYVFPSANHTRFEHSIGVMHLANEMFINCIDNAHTLSGKQNKYSLKGNNKIFNYKNIDPDSLEDLYYDLRVAALLHDIGHGPMSHLFDKFAPTYDNFTSMIRNDPDPNLKIDDYKSLGQELANSLETDIVHKKLIEHEQASYYLSVKLLRELGFSLNRIRRILTIMEAKLDLTDYNIKLGDSEYNILPFLNQIVAGAPLDCDRMDYLLRDSYFTGVTYGTYDLNRLLKSLLPFIDNEQKSIRLGIKKSGLPAIENFLQARYELYIQVYFHKTNRACNTMLNKATEELKAGEFIDCSHPNSFIESYLTLSDEAFLKELKKKVKNHNKDTIDDLSNRRLWKRVAEVFPKKGMQRYEDIESKAKDLKKQIIDKFPEFSPFINEDVINDNPLKGMDNDKTILLSKDESENYDKDPNENWLNNSIIVDALSSKYLVGRVYMKADTSTHEGKEKYRETKQIAQDNL